MCLIFARTNGSGRTRVAAPASGSWRAVQAGGVELPSYVQENNGDKKFAYDMHVVVLQIILFLGG